MEHLSNLSTDEAIELGTKIGALIGLGVAGEEGTEAGATAGAEAGADGLDVFTDEDAWDVLEDIPNDSAAALMLIEHHWAVPLRDAIMRAGGFRSVTGSSARSTSSRSACSPATRPSSCTSTRWLGATPVADRPEDRRSPDRREIAVGDPEGAQVSPGRRDRPGIGRSGRRRSAWKPQTVGTT